MAELIEDGTYLFSDDKGNLTYALNFSSGFPPRRIRYEDNAPKYLDEMTNNNWIPKLEYIDDEWVNIEDIQSNQIMDNMNAINQIIKNFTC